jgi:hypothetical protein
VALEQLPVDARLVVVALEVAERRELDQVRVALVGLREEGQVGVALLLRAPVVGDVDLAADQRLHALLPRLLPELDRAGERAVVRERDRRHLQLRRARGEVRDAARPIENRVLGVDVKVDERGLTHGRPILGRGPDGPSRRGPRAEESACDALHGPRGERKRHPREPDPREDTAFVEKRFATHIDERAGLKLPVGGTEAQ